MIDIFSCQHTQIILIWNKQYDQTHRAHQIFTQRFWILLHKDACHEFMGCIVICRQWMSLYDAFGTVLYHKSRKHCRQTACVLTYLISFIAYTCFVRSFIVLILTVAFQHPSMFVSDSWHKHIMDTAKTEPDAITTKTWPTLERRKTLGHLRSINHNMIIHFANQSQTCQLLKIHFFFQTFHEKNLWKVVQSIPGWTDRENPYRLSYYIYICRVLLHNILTISPRCVNRNLPGGRL